MIGPTKPPQRPMPAPAQRAPAPADLTTAKKPARRSVRHQTPAAVDAPPLDLTPAELALVAAYRTADDRGRDTVYQRALWQAENYPRHTKPSLCLVAGGAG